jgi:anti-sigma regulatory factor (Ser/Thr protein kinase)
MPNEDLQDSLVLDSKLTELSRAQSWAESLADRVGLSADTRYAVSLCLEEAIANVVLHGYRNEPGHPIVLRSWRSSDTLSFTIEDAAPPFAPPAPSEAYKHESLESLTPGGQGIRLLHHFAGSLAYERLPEGNRLTIGFLV